MAEQKHLSQKQMQANILKSGKKCGRCSDELMDMVILIYNQVPASDGQVIRKSKALGQKSSCCSRVKELQAAIGKKVQMGYCCLSSLPLEGKEGQNIF